MEVNEERTEILAELREKLAESHLLYAKLIENMSKDAYDTYSDSRRPILESNERISQDALLILKALKNISE